MAVQAGLISRSDATAAGSIQKLLRLEGLTIAATSAVLYAQTGAKWWLFAAFWLLPDLSMLGYLKSACWGARSYNAVHSYVLPITLALTALILHAHGLLPFALIWINHIGVDRLLGYGLKYSDGFEFTHLGQVGKRRITSPLQS